MKYFLDTEFHEYKKKPLIGKSIDTIELISIGITGEDGREYYAICKGFDIKAAWNSWQTNNKWDFRYEEEERIYWLRENVLKPIFKELVIKAAGAEYKANQVCCTTGYNPPIKFNIKNFTKLINKYGKTKEQVAEEIKEFVGHINGGGIITKKRADLDCVELHGTDDGRNLPVYNPEPEFYAYYADYDWVVFCWLFGRMIDLPKGFPMYCRDLKQILDGKALKTYCNNGTLDSEKCIDERIEYIKTLGSYPKQTNEHNALADARWNKELYKFLNKL